MLHKISPSEFEGLVEEALAGIPEPFLDRVRNTVVAVEEEPGDEDLDEIDLEEGTELLGIYRGVPFTEQSYDAFTAIPGEVVIFRGPVLRCSENRADALQQIRETVIHEIGHYFGLDDHEMEY